MPGAPTLQQGLGRPGRHRPLQGSLGLVEGGELGQAQPGGLTGFALLLQHRQILAPPGQLALAGPGPRQAGLEHGALLPADPAPSRGRLQPGPDHDAGVSLHGQGGGGQALGSEALFKAGGIGLIHRSAQQPALAAGAP